MLPPRSRSARRQRQGAARPRRGGAVRGSAEWDSRAAQVVKDTTAPLRAAGVRGRHVRGQVLESGPGVPSGYRVRTRLDGLSDDVSVVQYRESGAVRTEVHLGHGQVPDGIPRRMKADSRQEMNVALATARQVDFAEQQAREFRANAFKYAPPPRPTARPPRQE